MDLAIKEFYNTAILYAFLKSVYIYLNSLAETNELTKREDIVDLLFGSPCRLFIIWACFLAGTSVLATFF